LADFTDKSHPAEAVLSAGRLTEASL